MGHHPTDDESPRRIPQQSCPANRPQNALQRGRGLDFPLAPTRPSKMLGSTRFRNASTAAKPPPLPTLLPGPSTSCAAPLSGAPEPLQTLSDGGSKTTPDTPQQPQTTTTATMTKTWTLINTTRQPLSTGSPLYTTTTPLLSGPPPLGPPH